MQLLISASFIGVESASVWGIKLSRKFIVQQKKLRRKLCIFFQGAFLQRCRECPKPAQLFQRFNIPRVGDLDSINEMLLGGCSALSQPVFHFLHVFSDFGLGEFLLCKIIFLFVSVNKRITDFLHLCLFPLCQLLQFPFPG